MGKPTSTSSKLITVSAVLVALWLLHSVFRRWNMTTFVNSGGTSYGITSTINKEEKVERMKEIKRRLELVIEYCVQHNYPDQSRAFRMKQRWQGISLTETLPDESTVAYVVDKGRSMNVCLTDKETQELQDINTTMFVALHELAHIMSNSWGHGPEFWNNFRKILKVAIEIDVYTYVSYEDKNQMFCGTNIYSQPCSNSTCTE